MVRIPFAQLEAQRTLMLQRLQSMDVQDAALHQTAITELNHRVRSWWGGSLPPLSQFADVPKTQLSIPVKVRTNKVELLIVRAISASAEPAEFGVTPEGAVFTIEPEGGYQVFATSLSDLLDDATDVLSTLTDGIGGQYFEHNGSFFMADGTEFMVAVFEAKASKPGGKSFWQQVVSILPWVHDEAPGRRRRSPIAVPRSSAAPEASFDEPIYKLVIRFEAAPWPVSGVLKEMGYHVGKDGLIPTERRRILERVLRVQLIATSPETEDYIREWGTPGSSTRLRKMIGCLGGFIELAERRTNADMSGAIADWDSDLGWLRSTFGK